jgi:hypothetical protein
MRQISFWSFSRTSIGVLMMNESVFPWPGLPNNGSPKSDSINNIKFSMVRMIQATMDKLRHKGDKVTLFWVCGGVSFNIFPKVENSQQLNNEFLPIKLSDFAYEKLELGCKTVLKL